MDDRFQFWRSPASWPDDAYGFIFLARALQRAGTALFNDEWTGAEVVTAAPIESWHDIVVRTPQSRISQARQQYHRDLGALIASTDPSKLVWISEKYRVLTPLRTVPSLGRLSFDHVDDGVRTRRVLSEDSRKYGESLLADENQKRTEAKARWARVVGFVKDALRDGKLECVTLPTHGGAFSAPQPKEWWNVPSIENRLTMCQMNPVSPYGSGFAGNSYEYIFVNDADLERLLPQPPKPKTSADVKAIEDRAAAIYDRIKAERGGNLPYRVHEDACALEGIKSSPARKVWKLKNKGEYRP